MLMALVLISLKWFLICCVSCLILLCLAETVKFLKLGYSYPATIHNFVLRWSIILGFASGLVCVVSSLLLLISWIP